VGWVCRSWDIGWCTGEKVEADEREKEKGDEREKEKGDEPDQREDQQKEAMRGGRVC